ncbi:antiterminator Q family protein [Xylophilus sp. Leaf220]|uniref:antiterminator Q family protein n=1 Tax=Xylophilus sp. Leaf220 TaxID=1735686 RepID=UPI0006FBFC1B|nr:antiterminator Q family protein [Xylophilus sp. Leaf220]KQM68787.1 hypothetical protein ASE76_13905 [Xylophilus sp. Leaf220]
MARIEWVKSRLDNWALWCDRNRCGALGFASQAAFLHESVDESSRESRIPVDEIDAGITDQAVSSLKLSHPHVHRTLRHMYVEGIGAIETARRIGRARSTVLNHLEQADRLLSVWFIERKARNEQMVRDRESGSAGSVESLRFD